MFTRTTKYAELLDHYGTMARDIDERERSEAVVCFDVLEHIYLAKALNDTALGRAKAIRSKSRH